MRSSSYFILMATFGSIISLLAFQNCSQSGQLALKNGMSQKSGLNSTPQMPDNSGGELAIVVPNNSRQQPSVPSNNLPEVIVPKEDKDLVRTEVESICQNETADYKFVFRSLTLQCAPKDEKIDIEVVAGKNIFTLNSDSIDIIVKKDISVTCGQLFANFSDDENAIMKSDGEVLQLHPVGGMPKGFVRFEPGTSLKAGKYRLKLLFSTHKQDIAVKNSSNGMKECSFKPFFHAQISEL